MIRRHDFSKFKQEINLTQYAAFLGYEIDRKKSTKSSIAMRSGADKVIISRRGANWVYFSVSDDNDNGTIVDFIENRTNQTIAEIAKELNIWIGGGASLPHPKSYISDVQEQERDPARIKKIFYYCKPVIKHTYIESRGIKGELFQSKRFIGRIYTDRYQNAVFPHYKDNKLCGLELKNEDKSLFVRGSEKTLWRSNIVAGDNTLIIAEAVLDTLSYYQIFNLQNAIYTATGGGLSPEQIEIMSAFVSGFLGLQKVIIITDNDAGGDKITSRIKKALSESDFKGKIIRHSPNKRGEDWNDCL